MLFDVTSSLDIRSLALFAAIIRISSPGLPDVSDPTADGGSAPRARSRNCSPAAARSWTTPGPGVPGIVAGRRPVAQRPQHVGHQAEHTCSLKDDADRRDHIVDLPTATRIVGVNAPRHAENAGDMLRAEGQIESNEEKPEMPEAQFLVKHPAHRFRIPVINGGKDGEQQDRRSTRNESAPPRSKSRSVASRTAPRTA